MFTPTHTLHFVHVVKAQWVSNSKPSPWSGDVASVVLMISSVSRPCGEPDAALYSSGLTLLCKRADLRAATSVPALLLPLEPKHKWKELTCSTKTTAFWTFTGDPLCCNQPLFWGIAFVYGFSLVSWEWDHIIRYVQRVNHWSIHHQSIGKHAVDQWPIFTVQSISDQTVSSFSLLNISLCPQCFFSPGFQRADNSPCSHHFPHQFLLAGQLHPRRDFDHVGAWCLRLFNGGMTTCLRNTTKRCFTDGWNVYLLMYLICFLFINPIKKIIFIAVHMPTTGKVSFYFIL